MCLFGSSTLALITVLANEVCELDVDDLLPTQLLPECGQQ
jgi:hypothetical protein